MKCMLYLLCTLVFFTYSSAQLKNDWMQDEINCANSINIPLGFPVNPNSSHYLRHMTWVSDAVVIGSATTIEHDLTGPYPTIVTFGITQVLKGDLQPGSIILKLYSGPVYQNDVKTIGSRKMMDEPPISVNEQVIIFISKSYSGMDPSSPYALSANEYTVFEKLLFNGTNLIAQSGSVSVMSEAINDISFAAQSQESVCVN